MFATRSFFKCMRFAALLLAALGNAHVVLGQESPWGTMPPPAQVANLAWQRRAIEGFAWPTSIKPGEALKFYVSVMNQGGQNYQIQIFRIPEQADNQAQWTSSTLTGSFYPLRAQNGAYIYPGDLNPPKPVDFKIGCKSFWEPGAITISGSTTALWLSGMYYARLNHLSLPTGHAEKYYYTPFVVRAATAGSTSNILFKFDFNTFQAYNYWGGGSLYSLTQDGASLTSTDTLAMDRPLVKDRSDAITYFLTPFVKTLQDNGYVLEYCNNIDVDSTGAEFGINLLNKYKMLVIWCHDEYWSDPERTNTKTFKENQTYQGNTARFAPNTCYWRVNWIGTGHRRFFCRKDNWPDPQNHPPYDLWRDSQYGPGLPEAEFLGEQYERGFNAEEPPDIVVNDDHWIFRYTDLTNGNEFGYGVFDSRGRHGIVSGEVDNTLTYPANFPIEILAQRKVWSYVTGGQDSVLHQMIYYEDTNSNARGFAQGAGNWWLGLADNADHPDDVVKMKQITLNIFDHFSFKKYLGNIYANLLTWGDESLETATQLDGDTDILANKTLNLTGNFTLTINPGVTLYVDGTLSPGGNVTITGGGSVVTRGSGAIKPTSSADALAFNNSRKLVRDAAGDYHLVFENGGEIYYEKLINGGTALSEFRRLSSGNGSNKFPGIAERSGKLYVVWQRTTGTNTYTIHLRHFNATSWETIRTVTNGISSSNNPLPVIAICTPSAGTFEMMAAYRNGSGLKSKRSTSSNGSSWPTTEYPITSNTSARNPSLVYWVDDVPNLKFHVSWDEGSNIYHQTFNGTTNTWGPATNISTGTMASNHQYSSYAISGNNDRHVVWQAFESEVYFHQAIYHSKNLGNAISVLASSRYDHLRPSVAGHSGAVATVVCHDNSSSKNIRKRRYDGTNWQGTASGSIIASNGIDASVSMANPPGAVAEAVWRSTGTSPYSLTIGPSGGLNKGTNADDYVYHRRIVYSFDDSSTLSLQVDGVEIIEGKNKTSLLFPDVEKDSLFTSELAETLHFKSIALPANADSLALNLWLLSADAGSLCQNSALPLQAAFTLTAVFSCMKIYSHND